MSQYAGWFAAAVVVVATTFGAPAPARGGQETGEGAGEPRNIVFIFTDDQRFDGLGLRNDYFETPHLDRLAEGGVLFENAFVTTSLCSPSRASILSGLYAHTHQVLDNSTAMPRDLRTFPVGLQDAGYETAFIGKWHMGGASDDPRPGFDHWVSFRGQGPYVDPTLNINGTRVEREGYTTDLLTDYAVEFLRGQDDDRPFLLYLSHKAVHAPFTPAERHRGAYSDRGYVRPPSMADTEANYRGKPDWVRAQRRSWHGVDGMYDGRTDFDRFVQEYAEALMAVDDSVGRVAATLDELGLLDSTLLVFMSDNGFQFGEHGLIDKRTMYEASIRVPLIVHCPRALRGRAAAARDGAEHRRRSHPARGRRRPRPRHHARPVFPGPVDGRDRGLARRLPLRVTSGSGRSPRPRPSSGCGATATSSCGSTASGTATSSTTSRPTPARGATCSAASGSRPGRGPSTGRSPSGPTPRSPPSSSA